MSQPSTTPSSEATHYLLLTFQRSLVREELSGGLFRSQCQVGGEPSGWWLSAISDGPTLIAGVIPVHYFQIQNTTLDLGNGLFHAWNNLIGPEFGP